MAMKITEECLVCGACVDECPVEAITEGDDIFIIDADLCVECEGHNDSPLCSEICPDPDECIVKA
ncbi:MAG: ferredoxin [Chloroflexi bacterium]|nr:MAG: ferredoxin [Chloroflexota bacterium]